MRALGRMNLLLAIALASFALPTVVNVPETVIIVHVESTPQWGCKAPRESLTGGTVKECGWYK